ncbi:nucleotidyltransferase family protein [Ferrovibrio sp.]|uniref:nucleotidyltransferase family protein n=1 Tax=Ferrovibrio sp. TaxID=1917215 RepID=UPI003D0C3D30
MIALPKTAMVLAAGLGTRLKPITDTLPKPLIPVAGRSLLDRCLDRLVEVGVERAVVNIHWLGEQIRNHLQSRTDIEILISDESDALLETGGGLVRALPLLGEAPFFSVNADLIWRDARGNSLKRLAQRFDPAAMDALLLLQPTIAATGYDGQGDFTMDQLGQLKRRDIRDVAPFVYTGVQIVAPALLRDAPAGAFSLNLLYNRAIAAGRLYGMRHEGDWMDVGTHAGLAEAEARLAERISHGRRA